MQMFNRFTVTSLLAFTAAATWSFTPVTADDDAHAEPHAAPAHAPAPAPKAEPAHADPHAAPAQAEAKPAAKPAAKPVAKPAVKAPAKAAEEAQGDEPKTADDSLKLLMEGNERWMSGNVLNPSTGIMRRKMTADNGQKPFVTVLTCADSRIPVERVFDRGVGEVFVVRVAGNIVGNHEAGSIEYAVEHLETPLLVIMGHTKCGAVKAAAEGANLTENINSLLVNIKPAVDRAKKSNGLADPSMLVNAAVKENVWQSIFDLYKNSPAMIEMVKGNKVKVVGAVVDISTGKVEWMGEHPWQDAIVSAFSQANAAVKTADAEPKPAAHGH